MSKPRQFFEKPISATENSSSLFLAPFRSFWRSLVNHLIWESSSRQRKEYLEQCWSDAPADRSDSGQSHLAAALQLFQQTMTCKPEPEDWRNAASAYSQTWYELTAGKPPENKVHPNSTMPPQ